MDVTMGLNWHGELYVANREVSRANRHLTDTYMYKAEGRKEWHVAIT